MDFLCNIHFYAYVNSKGLDKFNTLHTFSIVFIRLGDISNGFSGTLRFLEQQQEIRPGNMKGLTMSSQLEALGFVMSEFQV